MHVQVEPWPAGRKYTFRVKTTGAAMSSADPTPAEDAAGPPGNPALELEALKAMCTGHLRADGAGGLVLPSTTLAGGEE